MERLGPALGAGAARLASWALLLCFALLGLSGCASMEPRSGGAATDNVPLECAPFARALSGIELRGAAADWWPQAEGSYHRTQTPARGSVLVFRRSVRLPDGHVASTAPPASGSVSCGRTEQVFAPSRRCASEAPQTWQPFSRGSLDERSNGSFAGSRLQSQISQQ